MTYFLIFSNCTLTKGTKRNMISDLQRQELFFIPDELYDILIELKDETLADVKGRLDVETQETVMEYLQYFVEQGIGFLHQRSRSFSSLVHGF